MAHPKDVGDRSTLAIMYGLNGNGYGVLLPFGENTRYDLVIDDGWRLSRVQCKTGRLRNGSIIFQTSSSYGHHRSPKAVKRHYLGEVEFFGVFCPDTGGVYLIPIDETPNRSQAHLRVDPPRNAQRRRIRYASTFEIARLSSNPPALNSHQDELNAPDSVDTPNSARPAAAGVRRSLTATTNATTVKTIVMPTPAIASCPR
jgi:hypothetical protein